MPITEKAEPGIDSSGRKMQVCRIDPLTIDEIPAKLTFRDPHSSKSMFSLPWEGDE